MSAYVEPYTVEVFVVYDGESDDAIAELRFYEGEGKAAVYVDGKFAGEYRPPNPFEIDADHFLAEFRWPA